jgi:hypothetical protein
MSINRDAPAMDFVDLYHFRAVVAPAWMAAVARLPRCIRYGVAGRMAWFDQVRGGALVQRLVCQLTDAAAFGMLTVAQAFSRPYTELFSRVCECRAAVVALRAALLNRAHAAAAGVETPGTVSVLAA